MNWGKILSYAMIIMAVGAGVGYFAQGDVRRGIYWLAAAVLNGAITL